MFARLARSVSPLISSLSREDVHVEGPRVSSGEVRLITGARGYRIHLYVCMREIYY